MEKTIIKTDGPDQTTKEIINIYPSMTILSKHASTNNTDLHLRIYTPETHDHSILLFLSIYLPSIMTNIFIFTVIEILFNIINYIKSLNMESIGYSELLTRFEITPLKNLNFITPINQIFDLFS